MTQARDVLAGVRVVDALRYLDVRVERRDVGLAFVRWCPRCGPRASVAVAVNLDSGRWFDESRGCRGEFAELVRGYAAIQGGDEALVAVARAIRAAAHRRRAIAEAAS